MHQDWCISSLSFRYCEVCIYNIIAIQKYISTCLAAPKVWWISSFRTFDLYFLDIVRTEIQVTTWCFRLPAGNISISALQIWCPKIGTIFPTCWEVAAEVNSPLNEDDGAVVGLQVGLQFSTFLDSMETFIISFEQCQKRIFRLAR